MPQTMNWSASKGMPIRRHRTTGATAGQGNSKRLYVGRYGSYDYDALLQFNNSWAGVGKIVSAYLVIYTGDGLGDTPSSTTESPRVFFRRNTGAWTEGNAADGSWQANDYDTAPYTTSDQRAVAITRETMGLNRIDITAIVEDWAPATVKRRSGAKGGGAKNYGLTLNGTTDLTDNIDFISEDWTDAQFRPVIELNYEYGPTVPTTPTGLTPSGSVAALVDFQGDFADVRPTDTLKYSHVQVLDAGHTASTITETTNLVNHTAHGLVNLDQIYFTSLTAGAGLSTFSRYYVRNKTANTFQVSTTPTGAVVDITNNYASGSVWSKLLYNESHAASRTEIDADHFTHVPNNLTLRANTTYRWRVRVQDQEGQWSAMTSLVSFSFANTAPNAPTLTPASASSFANPDGVVFRGTFSDADAGATMIAYEVQMSAYAEGDAHWLDDEFILWATGKRYITATTDPFETPYGGEGLAAGTYYWRARVYDDKSASSNWTYASITFTDTFEEDPDTASTAIQLRPRAPWRIVLRGMGALRGPGSIVAVIEDAKNVGASEMYNSPGELHYTVPKDHPQIAAMEPRQTHYSVQFRTGDGWQEKFAGLMTDFDATDTDVVFYGIDYLGLLDFIVDERYDPSNPEKPAEKGGSKYVTSGKNTINYIIGNSRYGQLALAKNLKDSPVGFITIGSIATMSETLTVYSTYSPVLQFVTGLLDSHRAGTGKATRLKVRRTSAGGYEWTVTDNPGQQRDNLRMRYGELVQGYRIVAFGPDWATRIHGIGRGKDGIKVMYDKMTGQGIPEGTWGRFTRVELFDGVSDPNDFKRRIRQAAMKAGKLGKQLGIGMRSLVLQPKDGYDVCDTFPVDIEDGSVSTAALGSGYFRAVGVTWQTSAQDGKQDTTVTFWPREDGSAPDADLLLQTPLSTQKEWQVGYTPPVSTASSRFWFDVASGKTYERVDGDLLLEGITGTA